MNLALPSETIFHKIESTIKEYRKFSQQNISNEIENITIDQSIVLLHMDKYPELTQKELAELIFKDSASMTRMIELMVKNKYLKRSMNELDRRRYKIDITAKGKEIVKKLPPLIAYNRTRSLAGITKAELQQLETILNKIRANCK